jgi:hypothetical protein
MMPCCSVVGQEEDDDDAASIPVMDQRASMAGEDDIETPIFGMTRLLGSIQSAEGLTAGRIHAETGIVPRRADGLARALEFFPDAQCPPDGPAGQIAARPSGGKESAMPGPLEWTVVHLLRTRYVRHCGRDFRS